MDRQTYGSLPESAAAPFTLAPCGGIRHTAAPQESPAAIQEHFSRILEGGALPTTGSSAEQRVPLALSPHSTPAQPLGCSADSVSMAAPVAAPNLKAWSSAQFRPSPLPSMGTALQAGRSHYFPGTQVPADGISPCASTVDFTVNPDKVTGEISSWGPSSPYEILSWAYFPQWFTLSCILAFLNPIWLTVHLGQDRTVLYWLGPWCRIAAVLPLIFLVGHMAHLKKHRPSKPVVVLCLLVPTVFFLVLSQDISSRAANMADQLFSTDCDIVNGKRQLERSWETARNLYVKCLKDTVRLAPASQNLTYSAALQLYRIQDCDEYANEERLHRADWAYLWYLEDEYDCAGWCTSNFPLWTFKETQDSCSVAASQIFEEKIAKRAGQVMLYSFGTLLGTSALLLTAGPFLRARGCDW